MKKQKSTLGLILVAALTMAFAFSDIRSAAFGKSLGREVEKPNEPEESQQTENQSKIQVVFALDCTGSMGGLIQAAKDKIWSIASGMSQANSQPDISFGFVFYRDRGDNFVTEHIPLTNDMDLAYRELMDMQARGGGDTPESVNQALFEAINDFKWDTKTNVYKVVFLVGDAPPHMDYPNDVKYAETCHKAIKKDIIINTIQCGNIQETTPIWKDIAQRAGGEFLQLAQSGSEIVIKCPHDKEISRLMGVIDETRVYYGSSSHRIEMESKVAASEKIKDNTSDDVQAKRAAFNYSNSANTTNYMGTNELISDLQKGKVKLENIKREDLPENMKNMSLDEKKKYVDALMKKRKEAEASLAVQIKERDVYVEKETAKLGEDAINQSFSGQVHNVVVKQALTKNIVINKKVKN
jgi:Mg-chelatase subunit ChlD